MQVITALEEGYIRQDQKTRNSLQISLAFVLEISTLLGEIEHLRLKK